MVPLEHYQARSETVDSERYCSHLTDELKPVIRTKRKRRHSQTAIFPAKQCLCA